MDFAVIDTSIVCNQFTIINQKFIKKVFEKKD